jgi:Protein of unknown function (DUF4235)
VSKVLFLPVSLSSGLLAGLIGKKIFALIWGLIDDEEPPHAEHREVQPVKLVLALAIDGAIFALVRGLVDHGARVAFTRVTGAWPGEERPEPE